MTHASREEVRSVVDKIRPVEVELNKGRAYWHLGIAIVESVDEADPRVQVLQESSPYFEIALDHFRNARNALDNTIEFAESIEKSEEFIRSMDDGRDVLNRIIRGTQQIHRDTSAGSVPGGHVCFDLADAFANIDARMMKNASRRAGKDSARGGGTNGEDTATSDGRRHLGQFKPEEKPIIAGGLDAPQVRQLLKDGWNRRVTVGERKNVAIVLSDSASPAGVGLYTVDIPEGTEYLHNPRTGQSILTS